MKRRTFMAGVTATGLSLVSGNAGMAQDAGTATPAGGETMTQAEVESGRVSIDGLEMYYEIHGTGETPPSGGGGQGGGPLVLMHGGLQTIDLMAEFVAELAQLRQVIAVELEGHGHTPLRGGPLSYEQMADDVAALAAELGLTQVDLLGYSLGGGVAWQVAIRHPQLVRRQIVISAPVKTEGWALEMREATGAFSPEIAQEYMEFPLYTAYAAVAPRPEEWPDLVTRVGTLASSREEAYDWTAEVQGLSIPIQIIIGDADSVLLAPALELFQLLGGGVIGDFAPLPAVQLGIIPGTAHAAVLGRTDVLIPMVAPFLDAPMPEAG
jgi:pimeloyl-ACP methyl ester carboxylesterase